MPAEDSFLAKREQLLPLLAGLTPLCYKLFLNWVCRGAAAVAGQGDVLNRGALPPALAAEEATCKSPVAVRAVQLKPERKGCGPRVSPRGSRHAQGRRSDPSIGAACPAAPAQPQPLGSRTCRERQGGFCEPLLQKLPPVSLHPDSSTDLRSLPFPALPGTPEFHVPTCEGRGKAVNKFLFLAAVRDSWA